MKYHQMILGSIMAFALIFAGCSKIKNTTNADPNASQHNQDINNVKSESDNVNADVNTAMTSNSGFGKNSNVQSLSICGATIDSTHCHDPQPYLILTFDGTTICPNPNRIRSGTIKVQLVQGTHWYDAGAKAVLTYTNYKVQYPALNNHYLIFNGTKYLTDVNGINWINYYLTGATTANLKERTYNMTVTFENGRTASWNCARLTTWNVTNYATFTATVNGDTTIGGQTIDSWGVTRFGTNFTTAMNQPWVSGTTCGWWNATSGQYTSVTDSFTVSALFGVNSSGTQQSSGCAYGFKLNWNYAPTNTSGEAILPYW
jgi:hypothetical protein